MKRRGCWDACSRARASRSATAATREPWRPPPAAPPRWKGPASGSRSRPSAQKTPTHSSLMKYRAPPCSSACHILPSWPRLSSCFRAASALWPNFSRPGIWRRSTDSPPGRLSLSAATGRRSWIAFAGRRRFGTKT